MRNERQAGSRVCLHLTEMIADFEQLTRAYDRLLVQPNLTLVSMLFVLSMIMSCSSARAKDFSLPAGMDMSSAMQSAEEVLQGKHHFSVSEKLFTYERAQGPIPEKARDKFKLALQEKYDHHPDKALRSFDEAIKLAPKYVPIYFEKAAQLADLKKTEQAISVCDQMMTINPKYLAGLHLRACCYDELHKYSQAAADYTSAIAIDKSDTAAFELRAKVYAKMGRQADAARDSAESDRRTVRQRVALAMAQGDSEKALKTIDNAVKNDPTNLELRTSKIFLCMASERQADAISTCTTMMKDFPELQGPLFCMRAKAYAALSKDDQAIADYTQAILILQHPPTVSGKNKKSIDDMIANASNSVLLERGGLYLKDKQYAKAIADYTKYLSIHEAATKVYLLRAQAYKSSGDAANAAADCKVARALDPNSTNVDLTAEEIMHTDAASKKAPLKSK